MDKKIVNRFTIGGTAAGPSIPSGAISRALGKEIGIDMIGHRLYVPVGGCFKVAEPGDTIVAYEDDSFDVEYKKPKEE